MNTSLEVSSEAEDLDPKQETGFKELVDRLVDFLDTKATAGSPRKVTRPEAARIPQPISNVGCPACLKILNLAERDIITQFTYILLQPPLHHVET